MALPLTTPAHTRPTYLVPLLVLTAAALCLVLGTAVGSARLARVDDWQTRSPHDMEPYDPTVLALSKAAAYDVFSTDVMVQHQYSRRGELTVLIWALEDSDQKQASRTPKSAEWEVRVVFPDYPSVKRARAMATHAPKLKATTKGHDPARIGRAIVAAAACLSWESGRELGTPFVVRGGEDAGGYSVLFTRLPFKPGAHTMVTLPRNLRRYRTMPGA
jgi:hypothetical protein